MCVNASDVIAITAVIIAILIPLIQTFYERRREWHGACELLLRSIDSLYEDVNKLVNTPAETNHLSYQHFLNQRRNLIMHYSKRFFLQKTKLEKAYLEINRLVEIPEIIDYEELINKGYNDEAKQRKIYIRFIQIVKNHSIKASELLIG